MARCIFCNRTDSHVAKIDDDACCITCAMEHNGPGKFEAYAKYHLERHGQYEDIISHKDELEDLGKVLILNQWSLDGSEDEYMTHDGWGYCAQFGTYLLYCDTRGFVTFDEFANQQDTDKHYMRLYEDGWGAQEDDAYIVNERGYDVYFNGKSLEIQKHTRDRYGNDREVTYRRCLAAIRLEMFKTGYYPNVWEQDYHGSLRLIKGV